MALNYKSTRATMPRLPKTMCQFSKEMKVYQPDPTQPVLMGWFQSKHKKWFDSQDSIFDIEEVYVEQRKYMKTRWNGYVSKVTFPDMDNLLLFILTFR